MKLLSGPTDWLWNPILQGLSYYVRGVDKGNFISDCVIFTKESCCWRIRKLQELGLIRYREYTATTKE